MKRLEQITAKALERVNHDRYLLSKAVGKRAEELNAGATPLVDMDVKKHKTTDIALHEIAEGKLHIEKED
ncbi:DNA-directed RNA polymerase subunit omega [Nitratifractor salsuginis]|uniref:DNA-directed RNA polymerase subunit omega n=1 Tax=Nitratifractor salsuginis (strain DSM 16511 / JCM 12458 / E9I37-1) TaxID=749222 RepID=E6X2Q5_NITSE|nr:DNA-directed RNA polymerase subunit omega [Nitratifractor salsuginis]ADV46121.1 DNA-directed RNA polymerase, omega subunit [Nitratifractor salsuginis DSM 16511]